MEFLSNYYVFLGQAVGFFALAICIAKYQFKEARNVLWCTITANVFWVLHAFMIGATSAVVTNSIAFTRNILGLKTTGRTRTCIFLVSLVLAFLIINHFANEFIDYVPFLGFFFFGLASISYENPLLMRIYCLMGDFVWLYYAIAVFSMPFAFSSMFGIISSSVGLWRYELVNIIYYLIQFKSSFKRISLRIDLN